MDHRTHVLFITPGLGVGGAETHLIRYANGLAARNYRVSVIVTGARDELKGLLRQDVGCWFLRSHFRNPLLWCRLGFIAKAMAPDVTFGWSLYPNFAAVVTTWFYRPKKLVVAELNYPPALRREAGPVRYLAIRLLTRWLFPRADVVSANSQGAVSVLQQWAPRAPSYRRIFNPLDFDQIDELAKQGNLPEAMVINRGEVLILALGRIFLKQKGFDELVRAVARLKDLPQWRLVIVGSGPDEKTLRKQIAAQDLTDRMLLLPAVVNPFPFYKAADIVVVPSRYEGFPNVLFEALALGNATVSTDCDCGPREMTAGGRYGRLVAVDDNAGIAQELRSLILNPADRATLGSEAKRYIRREYSEERVFNALVACFGT